MDEIVMWRSDDAGNFWPVRTSIDENRRRPERTPATPSEKTIAWFRRRVQTGAPDECWPWMGQVTEDGYGFMFQSTIDELPRRVRAHRMAMWVEGYEIHGLTVEHTCHTRDSTCNLARQCPHRRCCNPLHLELLTAIENNERRWTRARAQRESADESP